MKTKSYIFVVILVMFILSNQSKKTGTDCVTIESREDGTGNTFGNIVPVAQSFISTKTGEITNMNVSIYNNGATGDLKIELKDNVDNPSLWYETVPRMSVPGMYPSQLKMPLATKLIVNQGTKYYIVASSLDSNSGMAYVWTTGTVDAYPDGRMYYYIADKWRESPDVVDFKFSVTICSRQTGGTCNTAADIDCNNDVSDSELLAYAQKWLTNQVTDAQLLQAAQAWLTG